MIKQKLSIVKVGGKLIEEPNDLNSLLIKFLKIDGAKILVHGGGRLATTLAEKLGIETQFIDGRRITDEKTLEVVTMVYGGLVNKNIVAKLQANNTNAIGLTGADLNYMQANKREVKDVDYGYVGDIEKININELSMLINQNVVPVLAPLAHDKNGSMLNINADTIASETAIAFSSKFDVELIFCFEKPGVLLDANNDSTIINNLNAKQYKQLKESGAIHTGMIPKLDNSFKAISKGVKIIRITNIKGINNGGTTIS